MHGTFGSVLHISWDLLLPTMNEHFSIYETLSLRSPKYACWIPQLIDPFFIL